MPIRRDRKSAFTLIEALVAAGLLVVLGTVIWQLLVFGIRAHQKGEATRAAQSYARQVVDTLLAETRSAVALPEVNPFMYSGVLYPDPWGAGVTFNPTSFYSREEEVINGIPWDLVRNRLILTRASRDVRESAFNPGDISNYVYVDYVVPEDQRNRLMRNVYTVNALGASGHQVENTPTAFGTSRDNWVANPSYFTSGGNLFDSRPLVELPQATDRVEIEVLHPSIDDDVDTSPELFDPRTFTIRAKVRIGLIRPGPDDDDVDDDDFLGKHDLEGQIRVQSHKSEY